MAKRKRELSPDVNKQELGAIYAKALLAVAERAGGSTAESVVAELEDFVTDVLDAKPDFELLLASPRVSADAKSDILDRALGGKMSSELLTFLQVVAGKGRLDCVREMAKEAHRQLNVLRNRAQVHAETAIPLDEGQFNRLRDRIVTALGREVDLTTSVDPDMIGGIVVRIGDTVYDGSLANRLGRMRQHAIDQAYAQMQSHTERFAAEN